MNAWKTTTIAALCAAVLAGPGCGSKESKSKGEAPAKNGDRGSPDAGVGTPAAKRKVAKMPEVVLGDETVFSADADRRASAFAITDSHVWVIVSLSQGGTSLVAIPKAGEGAVEHAKGVMALAADETFAYYSASGEPPGLFRAGEPGAKPEKLAGYAPAAIAVGVDRVFWGRRAEVWSVPKAGGEPALAGRSSQKVMSLTSSRDNIYWSGDDSRDAAKRVGWIEVAPAAGGNPKKVVESIPNIGPAIQAHGGDIYYLAGDVVGLRSVMKVPDTAKAKPSEVFGPAESFFVADDSAFVAATQAGIWGIYRLPLDGDGAPTKVGEFAHGRALQVTADDRHVYWLFDGSIYRAAK